MATEVAESLGANCPNGGSFYICYDKPNQFVGCCSVDPCKTDDGICPDDDLRYTSFDKYSFNQLKAQECVSSDPEVQWFTCAETNEPYMGCCTGNPCGLKNGCAHRNMSAAVLNSDAALASPFMPASEDEGLSAGAKAGIGVGVALGVAAIVAIFAYFYLRMRNKKKAAAAAATTTAAAAAPSSSYEPHAQGMSDKPASNVDSKFSGSVASPSPYTSMYAPSIQPNGNGTYDPHQQNNVHLNVQQWQYQQSQQGASPTMSAFPTSNISSTNSPPPPQNMQPYGVPPVQAHPVELPNDFVMAKENAAPPAELGDSGK